MGRLKKKSKVAIGKHEAQKETEEKTAKGFKSLGEGRDSEDKETCLGKATTAATSQKTQYEGDIDSEEGYTTHSDEEGEDERKLNAAAFGPARTTSRLPLD